MRYSRFCVVVSSLLIATGAPAGSLSGQQATPPARVLFIGNSLTYVNNLPAMIEAIAESAGLKGRVVCRGVAKPDYGLQEHWDDGEALRGIQGGRWTHVVLQQGPSSQQDSRAVLRELTKRFAFEARSRGAKVVLYGVWPSRNRLQFQDAVTESYRLAAQDVNGSLIAVGEGWRAAWQRDPTLPLYGPDEFHPSPMGTYLAALMFFEHFAGRSSVGLPPPDPKQKAFEGLKIDAAQLNTLQAAAQHGLRTDQHR